MRAACFYTHCAMCSSRHFGGMAQKSDVTTFFESLQSHAICDVCTQYIVTFTLSALWYVLNRMLSFNKNKKPLWLKHAGKPTLLRCIVYYTVYIYRTYRLVASIKDSGGGAPIAGSD